MSVDTASAVNHAATSLRNSAGKSSSGKSDKLGKSDFLNLFMTQMANQDPTSPMDSSAMMGNLAQMGIMEQMENMNNQMGKLVDTQGNSEKYSALQLLGKDVSVAGDTFKLENGRLSSSLYFNLPQEANQVNVRVKGEDGNIVANIDMGLRELGKHKIKWDGKDDMGRLVPNGTYTFLTSTTDEDGKTDFIDVNKTEKVRNVEFRQGEPWLNLATMSIPVKKAILVEM